VCVGGGWRWWWKQRLCEATCFWTVHHPRTTQTSTLTDPPPTSTPPPPGERSQLVEALIKNVYGGDLTMRPYAQLMAKYMNRWGGGRFSYGGAWGGGGVLFGAMWAFEGATCVDGGCLAAADQRLTNERTDGPPCTVKNAGSWPASS
jgi:hypothetical protein